MRSRAVVIIGALLVAAVFATASSAVPYTGKTVVRIDTTGGPSGGNPSGGSGRFTLQAGKAADRGSSSYAFSGAAGSLSLSGRHGNLMLKLKHTRSGLNVDSEGLDLWTGTWTVTGGTGRYEGVHGVGAFVGIIGPSYRIAFHLEGFLPQPLGG